MTPHEDPKLRAAVERTIRGEMEGWHLEGHPVLSCKLCGCIVDAHHHEAHVGMHVAEAMKTAKWNCR